MSNVAFADALTDMMRGVLVNIGAVGVLAAVNVNVFAGTITAFEYAMPCPLEGLRW